MSGHCSHLLADIRLSEVQNLVLYLRVVLTEMGVAVDLLLSWFRSDLLPDHRRHEAKIYGYGLG